MPPVNDELTVNDKQRIQAAMEQSGCHNIHDLVLVLLDKLKSKKA